MKITGPKKLVKRAEFVAKLLGLQDFRLKIDWHKEKGQGSYCECNDKGTYRIYIDRSVTTYWLVEVIGHEMTHLRQMKHDRLRDEAEGFVIWEGKRMAFHNEVTSDEYWLSPWEMEARAMEAWVGWHWRGK